MKRCGLVVSVLALVTLVTSCGLLSPDPISELVGEWESLDGKSTLKVNSDKTYVYKEIVDGQERVEEGTIKITNDYIISATTKDGKTNHTMYFFIKDSRFFRMAYKAEGSVSGIKGKWKTVLGFRYDGNEVSTTFTLDIDDNKMIISGFGEVVTNTYRLLDGKKDIALLMEFTDGYGAATNAYVLADWKGNKMLFLVDEPSYDSMVFRKVK